MTGCEDTVPAAQKTRLIQHQDYTVNTVYNCDITQVVSRRLLTAEALVQSQTVLDNVALGQVLSKYFSLLLSAMLKQCSILIHLSSTTNNIATVRINLEILYRNIIAVVWYTENKHTVWGKNVIFECQAG